MEAGRRTASSPGLGARDTLRLEMKYALYGNDIDESTDPTRADWWIVKLDMGDFVGRDALARIAEAGPAPPVGRLPLLERGIPRATGGRGWRAGVGGPSGAMSPTLAYGIGPAICRRGARRRNRPAVRSATGSPRGSREDPLLPAAASSADPATR
jgi:aminomethyltransferase